MRARLLRPPRGLYCDANEYVYPVVEYPVVEYTISLYAVSGYRV
jgi:hypothetical protein